MPRKIWINIPAYPSSVETRTLASLMAEVDVLRKRGDEVTLSSEVENCCLENARGILVERFLNEGDGDVFAFVDSDVSWEAGKLAELIGCPGGFKVGIYPLRCDNLEWPLAWEAGPHLIAHPDCDKLVRIARGPTGFMVLERQTLADMAAHYNYLDCYTAATKRGRFVSLFSEYWQHDVELPDGTRGNLKFGDDYALCQRWRDMGGQIWAMPDITFGHTGPKTFTGNLGQWLLNRPN